MRKSLRVPDTATGELVVRMFLTATEVGQQLGLGKSRVYELAAAGMLPVVRLGRRMLFPQRGLDALAEAAIQQVRLRIETSSTER